MLAILIFNRKSTGLSAKKQFLICKYKPGSLMLPGFKLLSGGATVTFMNQGMQNKKQRIIVLIIIGIVLVSFIISIVALAYT
jgi:hypothetical protein